jgi:NADPH:quinone reductase-like Zn-dependent oxidoreductase/acyl carrier protein
VEDLAVAVDDIDSWSMLLQELAALDQTPAGLIYLLGSTEETPAEADRCWPVLAFLQARDRIGSTAPLTLALITAGAHTPASDLRDVSNPLFVRGSGQLWGLGRVLQNEKSEIRCRMIDLAFGRDDSSHQSYADSLAAEILSLSDEAEVALTRHGRFGLRTRPWHGRRAAKPNDAPAIKLSFTPGSLERLTWRTASRRAPRDGEVEIEVEATGLNFRDVMFAMGVLPDEAVERGFAGATLGLEAAGRIVRVGADVERFKVGDAVMCFASACFGSHVTVTERAVMAKPANLGFAEAATIPTAYFTVYYALKYAGQIRAKERILVHGGAGAVGLAAIRYALHVGAEVYATAGNDEKRMIVALSGVPAERIFDSRSLAFADKILEMTDGEGVDLVLNSLAGEAILKNLAILKPFGRLLELGKRDFYANTRVGLRPFRNNVSFHGIDVDQLMVDRPQLASELFDELSLLVESGVFTPLPYRRFESSQVVSAFRHLQQSRHVGKIVVSAPSGTSDDAMGIDTAARLQFDPAASYLVTGGLSGFGLATAEWLTARGARHLVLVGRRGTATPGAGESIERLQALGATVDVRAVDIADAAAVRRLVASLDSSAYPLHGVFHAAAIFDDGVIDSLTRDRFARVVAPKALGAHALDGALGDRKLDHFVLFSSISTLFGNPGQANYVAANMEMEALALQRRRRGLAATAICFPPIEDAGYLLRNSEVREALRDRLGVKSMTAAAALQELERLLAAEDTPPVIAAVEVDWRAAGRIVPALKSARFRNVFNSGAEHAGDTLDLAGLAASLSPAEWVDLIGGIIVEIAAEVLRAPATSIDRNKSIFDLGMDSLMLVEMKLLIDERLGVDIPQMSLTESATINRISDRVAASLANRGTPSAGTTALAETAASLASQHSESVAERTVAAAVKDVRTGAVRSRLVT